MSLAERNAAACFYLSYVFTLRLPSEASPARRAAVGDSLPSRRPLPRQSVLGLRSMPGGQQCLVLKPRTGKHVRSGAALFRPIILQRSSFGILWIMPHARFLEGGRRDLRPGPHLISGAR